MLDRSSDITPKTKRWDGLRITNTAMTMHGKMARGGKNVAALPGVCFELSGLRTMVYSESVPIWIFEPYSKKPGVLHAQCHPFIPTNARDRFSIFRELFFYLSTSIHRGQRRTIPRIVPPAITHSKRNLNSRMSRWLREVPNSTVRCSSQVSSFFLSVSYLTILQTGRGRVIYPLPLSHHQRLRFRHDFFSPYVFRRFIVLSLFDYPPRLAYMNFLFALTVTVLEGRLTLYPPFHLISHSL